VGAQNTTLGELMKTVLFALFAISFAGVASAASITLPAADSSACTTATQKAQLARYLNGKSDAAKPACYKPVSVKVAAMSSAACKGLDKQAARNYLNGKSDAAKPACLKLATVKMKAASSANCNNWEKQQVRNALSKGDRAFPACYNP
jgi:hypothetical protein